MNEMPALAAPPGLLGQPGPRVLSRKAKAAIVVQFLLNDGTDVPLSALPDPLQEDLTLLLGNMRYIDRETLNSVVAEFSDELEAVGLSFPGDIAGALSVLDGKISAQTAMRLRKEAGVRQTGEPWDRINALSPERLKDLVISESNEIAAVMMSKIDVGKAAQVLSKLPGDKARRISFAVSMTTGVTPEAVDRIGLSLAAQIEAEPAKAFDKRPHERLGAILNYSDAAVRNEVLTRLDEEDAIFADAVRRAIFTFANIPDRIKKGDVPKITRDVPSDVLATAIAAATDDDDLRAANFLLENMSRRLAEAMREEAGELGTVKAKPAEKAKAAVVNVIRELLNVGEIELRSPDEDG